MRPHSRLPHHPNIHHQSNTTVVLLHLGCPPLNYEACLDRGDGARDPHFRLALSFFIATLSYDRTPVTIHVYRHVLRGVLGIEGVNHAEYDLARVGIVRLWWR